LSGGDGLVVRVSCQAPRGDLVITDWMFSTMPAGSAPATIYVGQRSEQAFGVIGQAPGGQALTTRISPTASLWDPLPRNAEIRVQAAGAIHYYPEGAAGAISDVINSCRVFGS
jgi:hypothetical protein